MAVQARDELDDDVQQPTDTDMAVMTCCDPWTVKHLVAHLTALGNQSAPNFMLGMLKARGSFDTFVNRDLQRYLESTEQMKEGFEATLARTRPSPGPKYVMLGEYTMHGEDIRRALGRRGSIRPNGWSHSRRCTRERRRRSEGHSFRATDGNWSIGDGPETEGPGIDLVRAISGRSDAYKTLSGPGLEILKER